MTQENYKRKGILIRFKFSPIAMTNWSSRVESSWNHAKLWTVRRGDLIYLCLIEIVHCACLFCPSTRDIYSFAFRSSSLTRSPTCSLPTYRERYHERILPVRTDCKFGAVVLPFHLSVRSSCPAREGNETDLSDSWNLPADRPTGE